MQLSQQDRFKRRMAQSIAVIAVIAALLLGLAVWMKARGNPLAEDAVLGAPVVHVAASVPGRITQVAVKENAQVKRGDLLFSIDPTLYQLRVEQAAAELKIVEAARGTQLQTSSAEASNASIADRQVTRARNTLKLAGQTVARLQPLQGKGYVTDQQLDDALTAQRAARISLDQAVSQAQAAQSLVIGPAAVDAQVVLARKTLAIAEQELANTRVHAPHDGRVGGLTVASGEYVLPGQSIFTLIDTQDWFASAFFRETELARIARGSCASVYVMADRRRVLEGRVEDIGWGVASTETLDIPRNLPYVQKSLNWVRIAQRFPVRVTLKRPPPDLMRIGASAVVVVHDRPC